MKHEMRLHDDPFKLIVAGTKTIEMRLYDEKRQEIKIGDEIEFTNRVSGHKQLTKVVNLHRFNSFDELYNNFDKILLGYGEDEEANPNDMSQYYSSEDLEKYGVVGIEIVLI